MLCPSSRWRKKDASMITKIELLTPEPIWLCWYRLRGPWKKPISIYLMPSCSLRSDSFFRSLIAIRGALFISPVCLSISKESALVARSNPGLTSFWDNFPQPRRLHVLPTQTRIYIWVAPHPITLRGYCIPQKILWASLANMALNCRNKDRM